MRYLLQASSMTQEVLVGKHLNDVLGKGITYFSVAGDWLTFTILPCLHESALTECLSMFREYL